MPKSIAITLLVVGVLLIAFGISFSESFNSDVNRLLEGSTSDRTLWFIGGGISVTIIGIFGLCCVPKAV